MSVETEQTIEFSAPGSLDVGGMVNDLIEGAKRVDVWSTFAWDQIQKRYRRSQLGLAWIIISYLMFVVAIGIFFSGFSSASGSTFMVYVATGFAIFSFLIANLLDGCAVFRESATWIRSSALPYSIYVYKSIARSLFVFVLNLLVAFGVILYVGWRPSETVWLGLLAIPIYLINAVWVQFLFGLLAARARDLTHLVASISRLLFFTTPILWVREERDGIVAILADINPFTHFIEILRAPIMGTPGRQESWIIVGCITVVGILATLLLGGRFRRRLPFWL